MSDRPHSVVSQSIFTPSELKLLRSLNTPVKLQNYLEKLPINFELKSETCMSPRRVLRERKAHCLEGAMFAAAAFWVNGQPPLLLDLKTMAGDYDHVVTPFRRYGRWGAISKTNHGVLRYREPVYATPRELALSYFHEYFLDDGRKTLRSYSRPFDLSRFNRRGWMTDEADLWYISEALDAARHYDIIPRALRGHLRPADTTEIAMGKLTQWRRPPAPRSS